MKRPETWIRATWIETTATVTSCRFQFARLNTLTLGFQTGQKFRIAFDYYAHGQIYSDEFGSPTAIAQNTRIPVSYNPLNPRENSRISGSTSARSSLVAFGVAGSVVLSLVWFALLRGCG